MVFFVNNGVLVYARDASEPKKQPRAAEWVQRLWQERSGRLSTQVLQEYYVVVTQKLAPGLPVERARADVRLLQAWQPIMTDNALLDEAWQLEDRYQLSFWDALIVAAAIRSGAQYLLTEDLQDGQEIDSVRALNPFAHAIASL